MMRAWVSGQAATAVLSHADNRWQVFALDEPEPEAIEREAIPLLFAGATDVVEISVSDTADLVTRLEHEWTRDRALQLLLIVLDSDSDLDVRADAARVADELLLGDKPARSFAQNVLFSRPIPASCDLQRSIQIATAVGSEQVSSLLTEIVARQREIAAIAEWFDRLPGQSLDQRFAKDDLQEYLATIARSLALAQDRLTIDAVVLELAAHPAMRRLSDSRAALQDLRRSLEASSREPMLPTLLPESARLPYEERQPMLRVHAGEALDRVNREKDEIMRRIRNGQDNLAKRYTEQLIERQVASKAGSDRAVKTLCDLAKQAKQIRRRDLHLYFASLAVDVKPDDAIARSQLADAYTTFESYDEALREYALAEQLLNDGVSTHGRAEIFKQMGNFDDAIAEYDRSLLVDPHNQFGLGGKAEALKESGRLSEALATIDYAINVNPTSSVLLCGRGGILMALGRYDDALEAFDTARSLDPSHMIAYTGHAEVLEELEKHDQAISEYRSIVKRWPDAMLAHNGLADALRRAGRLDESITAFQFAIQNFNYNYVAHGGLAEAFRRKGDYTTALAEYETALALQRNTITITGRAGVLRNMGRLDEALAAYEEALRMPRSFGARIGKASTLLRMRQPEQALAVLEAIPVAPTTRPEWGGLYVRGMAYLRIKNYAASEAIFSLGAASCPFSIRLLFANAKALVEVRQRDYRRAIRSVEGRQESLADIIRLHAFGAVRDEVSTAEVYQRLQTTRDPDIASLRDRIADIFVFKKVALASEDALFEDEIDLFAEAA